jgi:hypothetical protein
MCCDSGGSAPAPADNVFTNTLAEIAKGQYERSKTAFQPLEDKAIAQVEQFQSPEYLQEQTGKAVADTSQAFDKAGAQSDEQLSSMGVNPNEGKYGFIKRGLATGKGLAEAGAFANARDSTRRLAWDTLTGMAGRGDAKVGQAIGAGQAGGNIYSNLQRNQMDWQNQNSDMSGIGSALGMGARLFMMSSKKAKVHRRLATGATEALRKMPVQTFQYKRGLGPPGTHVGPMAEDMKAATGKGDGQHIYLPDAMGVHMAATQELDKRVSKLESKNARPRD